MSAWMALAGTSAHIAHSSPLPATGVAWVLLAAWPLLSMAAASVTVARRDV